MTRPVAMPTLAASGSPAGVSSPASASIERKPGPDRPLGLVLVRLRPAEIGEHAIAHVFGDVPAPALDHLGAALLIGADDATHVLGIEPRGQLGRADQIDEHHGQLPPLGFRYPPRRITNAFDWGNPFREWLDRGGGASSNSAIASRSRRR